MSTNRATVYLILQASRTQWGVANAETGLKAINGLKVVAVRQGRPTTIRRDQIVVKLAIEVPESVFNPIQPAATVVVPEGLVLRGPIEVEAEDVAEVRP